MNKEYQELIDEVYETFQKTCQFEKDANHILPDEWMSMSNDFMGAKVLTQEEFIDKCKTDIEFSQRWGFEIDKFTTVGVKTHNDGFSVKETPEEIIEKIRLIRNANSSQII